MASTFTVQSLFYQTPSLELLRRPTQSSSPTSFSLPLVSLRPSASGCGVRGGGRSFVHCSAIATPNNILTEEAFKNLGRGFSSDDEEEELLRDSEEEGDVSGADKEELAVSRLGLPQRLVQSLEKRGITHLFPIQRAVLLPALEGQDIIARAKTGTGKTLAFGIPILKRLTEEDDVATSTRRGRLPRVLVLAPTRELANQVEKEIKESAPYLSTVCVYGGVSYVTQQNALTRGVDVVVGTPGRIIDLIKSNSLKLGEVEFLVLDEADQMLAVGFEEDVETILQKLPSQRQSMLFSATMPGWVNKLSRKYLNNPLTIDLVGDQDEKLAEGIKLYALSATSTSKRTLLNDLITVYAKGGKTIVFTQTKRDADEVSLALSNTIASEALHGDISQHQRERTLNGFRQGKFTVLVATDVAARGLDIPNVDLIIHYELPNDPETFVHRSGRTGRAGKEGKAILMYTNSQRRTVRSLERDVGCKFEYISAPGMQDVLESSAAQVVAALKAVHSESVEFFTPTAERLIKEEGVKAFAAALAHLSGFSKPPSSRSLLTHEQGWVTFQLTRDQAYTRGYLSARSVTGFLSDVFPAAADAVGKIHMVADQTVQAAVFDVPEEIAKELLNKEIPIGNTITKLSKLPPMQDDGPAGDFYGKFGGRERSGGRSSSFSRRGGGGGGGYGRSSSSSSFSRGGGGWGSGRDSNDDYGEDSYRRSGGGGGGGGRGRRSSESSSGSSSWSRASRSSGDDWLIGGGGGRSSSRPFSSRDRGGSFGGACFVCGRSGHKASDCPGN